MRARAAPGAPRRSTTPEGSAVRRNGVSRIASKRRAARRARSASALPPPLDAVYARAGIPAPEVTTVPAARIPSPYRSLLVHERDMTPTLEAHVGGPVALRTLSVFREGRWYLRRVLLVEEHSGRPVAMGVVRIDLDAFSRPIRERILRNRVPLGRLLRNGGVDYVSRPTAFLAVRPNPEMLGMFWMREPRTLYGRQTEVTLEDRKVGDVVEILPLA